MIKFNTYLRTYLYLHMSVVLIKFQQALEQYIAPLQVQSCTSFEVGNWSFSGISLV